MPTSRTTPSSTDWWIDKAQVSAATADDRGMNREKARLTFDAARVAFFRSRIRAGTFRVDAAAVAERMLRDAPRCFRAGYRPS